MILEKQTRKEHRKDFKKLKIFLLTFPLRTDILSGVRAFVVVEVDFLSVA